MDKQFRNDATLSKFDHHGTLKWHRQFGSLKGDKASAITVSEANSKIYVGGQIGGALLSSLNKQLPGQFSFTQGSAYVKTTRDCSAIVARGDALRLDDTGVALRVDCDAQAVNSSHIKLNAAYTGASGSNKNVSEHISSYRGGGTDAFLAEFSSSGDLIWMKGFGSIETDAVYGIDRDLQGNVYVTG